jgi:transposase
LEEAYDYLCRIYSGIGFDNLKSDILKHFAVIRVLEPASKLRSIMLLEKYFGLHYRKTTVFRELQKLTDLKEEVVRIAIKYARNNLNFDFSLVFYDVTTLYFETDNGDDFRKSGFSKDNKINQPQILVGLVVNDTGFPVYFDLFEGNTFEGKTIIPVILGIRRKYHIRKFTVVADAGMLSQDNLSELEKHNIDYVVGARIGSMNLEDIQRIASRIRRIDKKIIREDNLLFDYSEKRAAKDRTDNDRQIKKAEYYLHNPSKVFKRSKFLSTSDRKTFKLNARLVEKYRLLEGIKGYKTNISNIRNELLISRYRDLWRIEQSFRMAKSDLEARPMYHRRKNSIEYHILIVFVALCMGRVIELEKGESIRKTMDNLRDKWTIYLKDEISGNTVKLHLDKIPH